MTGRTRHLTLQDLSSPLPVQDMGNGKALQNGGGSTGSQEGYGVPADPKKRRSSGISSVQDTKPLLAQSDSSIDRSLAAPEEHTVSRSGPGCLHLRCLPATLSVRCCADFAKLPADDTHHLPAATLYGLLSMSIA